MNKEKYLFFRSEVDMDNVGGVGGTTGGGSSLMVPASRLSAMSPTSNTNLRLTFDSVRNSKVGGSYDNVIKDYVDLTIGDHTHKVVMDSILQAINGGPHSDGFVMVADDVTTLIGDSGATQAGSYINNNISACTVSLNAANSGATTAYAAGTTYWSSYGAGAVSTEIAPSYEQTKIGEEIISTIKVDLDGLLCKGDAANDVIGLASNPAYIGKYLSADMGVLYKAEITCLEIPGQQTATITTDIDVAFNSGATIAYDGPAGTAEINTGGFAALGHTTVSIASPPTNNDYIYLVEGDTAATTGEFNGGKLVIRLYGRATF